MNFLALYIGIVTFLKSSIADLIGYNRQQNNVFGYLRNSLAAENNQIHMLNLLNFYAQNAAKNEQNILLAKLKKMGKVPTKLTKRKRFRRFHKF